MRVPFSAADLGAVEECWRSFFPARYAVDASLLKQNTLDCPVFDWGASSVEVDGDGRVLGFLVMKKSASPALYKGADPDQAHVSALGFRDPCIAVDLLAQAKQLLHNRGVSRLVFGADSGHFFPGCPDDCASLRDLLVVEGFRPTGSMFDMERDLAGYVPPPGALDALAAAGAEVRLVPPDDAGLLLAFLEREFPGRWRYDTLRKVQCESACVYGLFVGDECEGFAMTQGEGCRLPIGGAVWRESLAPAWGSLGPIGVAKHARGRGLGHGLLAAALLGLKAQGVRRCIIDWTVLTDFYGAHGFEAARRYHAFAMPLRQVVQ